MNILILGGTAEARALADRLVKLGHAVTTSLAGRTSSPLLPAGDLRVGKFGGIPGLVGYLAARRIDRLVDATHPYAGLISINAVAAAERTGIPLVRFMLLANGLSRQASSITRRNCFAGSIVTRTRSSGTASS